MSVRSYKTEVRRIKIGTESIQVRCFANFDETVSAYIDSLGEDQAAANKPWPVFGTLWPSALALCQYLSQRQPNEPWQDKRVIELGCGLALPSLLLAKRQAQVLATDAHPDVACFLEENQRLNQIEASRLCYRRYDWRVAAGSSATTALPPADYILASDILYDASTYESLANCLLPPLQMGSTVILANPARFHSSEFYETLENRAASYIECRASSLDGILIREYYRNSDSSSVRQPR